MNALLYSNPKIYEHFKKYNTDLNENKATSAYFTDKISSSLADSFKNDETLNLNMNDMSHLLERILTELSNLCKYHSSYFTEYFFNFLYETLFNVYHDASMSLKSSVYTRDSLVSWHGGIGVSDTSYEQTLSKNRKSIQSLSDLLKFDSPVKDPQVFNLARSHKAMDFYSFISHHFLLDNGRVCNIAYGRDAVFNIENFKRFIYHPNQFHKGIQFYNLKNILSDYQLRWHTFQGKNDLLCAEYSAYLLEQLHYSIQYQKCIESYVQQDFINSSNDLTWDFPLLMYTKLFDTNYLSLTDYIMIKYSDRFADYYSNTKAGNSVRFSSYLEMQLLNTCMIPLIDYIIREFFFLHCKGDLIRVQALSYTLLCNFYQNSDFKPYTYTQRLNNTISAAKFLYYPDSKYKLIDKTPKNTSKEYLFNQHMSIAFFGKNFYNYFYSDKLYAIENFSTDTLKFLKDQLIDNYDALLQNLTI